MSRLKGGPELKVPQFAEDLVYDLRDRRLLPLVALIVVAIVAVPFLLSTAKSPAPSPSTVGALLTPQPSSGTARLTVVEANPGLRDYHKRLGNLRATDPFAQHYTGAVLKKGAAPSAPTHTTSTTSTSTTTGSATAPSGPTVTTPTTGSGTTEPSKPHVIPIGFVNFTIDVRVVHKGKAQTRKGVREMTRLPSKHVPAVVFMGVTSDAKKALLLVSSNVNSVFGDGRCSLGSKTCDLLEVEPGLPETFVFGPNNRSYRITILKIHPVLSRHP